MLFNSIRGSPWELQPRAEGGVVNPERQAPPPTVGEQLPRRVCIKRSVELARYGYTDKCIGCQHARACEMLLLQIHGAPAAARAAVPIPIPAAVQQRLPHRCRLTKAVRTAQKDRKLPTVLIWTWKGWSWNLSGIVFNDTVTVIF